MIKLVVATILTTFVMVMKGGGATWDWKAVEDKYNKGNAKFSIGEPYGAIKFKCYKDYDKIAGKFSWHWSTFPEVVWPDMRTFKWRFKGEDWKVIKTGNDKDRLSGSITYDMRHLLKNKKMSQRTTLEFSNGGRMSVVFKTENFKYQFKKFKKICGLGGDNPYGIPFDGLNLKK